MAQLKSTTITGSARVTDTLTTNTLQTDTIKVLSDSDSSTYGAGTDGQFIQSNGQKAYWGTPTPAQVGLGNAKIYSGTCTTAAGTTQKDVTCPDFTEEQLVQGAIVFVTFTHTNSGAVGSLTLKVGSSTAKSIKHLYNNTPTSNIPYANYLQANQTYPFYYNGTHWVVWMQYNTNSTSITTLYRNGSNFTAANAVYRYQFLFTVDENTLTPLNTINNAPTAAKTLLTNQEFDPVSPIYYYNSTTNVNADAAILGANLFYAGAQTISYTFNVASTAATGFQVLTINKPLYLKTILQSSGKVKIASNLPLAQELPTTNDGYLYIYLGRVTAWNTVAREQESPVYYHNGTEVVRYYGNTGVRAFDINNKVHMAWNDTDESLDVIFN